MELEYQCVWRNRETGRTYTITNGTLTEQDIEQAIREKEGDPKSFNHIPCKLAECEIITVKR